MSSSKDLRLLDIVRVIYPLEHWANMPWSLGTVYESATVSPLPGGSVVLWRSPEWTFAMDCSYS